MLSDPFPNCFDQQVLKILLIQEVTLNNRPIFHYIVQEEPIRTQEHVHHLETVILDTLGEFLTHRNRERSRLIDAFYKLGLGFQSQDGKQCIRLGCFISVLLNKAETNITAVVAQTIEKSVSEEVTAFTQRCVVDLELQVNGRISSTNKLVSQRPRQLIVDSHIHVTVRHTGKVVDLVLFFLKLALALQNIAVNLFVVLYDPVNALIFVVLLLQIVVEALFQVSECTGESGLFRFDLIQAKLQSRNQSSFLLVGKCQFALFKELFKIAEVFAEVNEVLTGVIERKEIGGNLVDLFNRTDKGKQVLLGDFVLVVDRQVFEFGKSIIAGCVSQFVVVLCISLNDLPLELVIGSYILKENRNIVESSEKHFAGGNTQNIGGQALFDGINIEDDLAVLIVPKAINRREELANGIREEVTILGILGVVDFQQGMYIAICGIYLLIQMPQNCSITPHIVASFHDAA